MEKEIVHFWEKKQLSQMSESEWDSLCDKCGNCCLEKIEDSNTGRIEVTKIACRFLDIYNCRCIIYEERLSTEPDCIKLKPKNIKDLHWLPQTCAYRRIYEGKKLESWHPLISGDPEAVHQAGISVRGRALPYGYYPFEEDLG